ncbi:hypothetical protein I4U23_019940 [Adineta vaga]|nr:hypothetical protein I4U23_019940 [Adineta vaga]
MFSLIHLTIFIIIIQVVSSLRCYGFVRSTDSSPPIVGIQDSSYLPDACMNQTCLCVSFMFQCINSNNTLCTTQQLQNQSFVWTYALTGMGTCQHLVQTPIIKNLTCCYTDLCNNQSINAILPITTNIVTISLNNDASFLSLSLFIFLFALYIISMFRSY